MIYKKGHVFSQRISKYCIFRRTLGIISLQGFIKWLETFYLLKSTNFVLLRNYCLVLATYILVIYPICYYFGT